MKMKNIDDSIFPESPLWPWLTAVIVGSAVVGAIVALMCGCSTTATKGWIVGGACPVDGFPLAIVDSSLESATAAHRNGGMVIVEDCMNPDFTHEYLVTNFYNVPVAGVKVWKP